MSTLHVLMPPMSRTDNDPALRHWLARGDRLADVQNARATVLREQFRFTGNRVPAAALRHHCHAGDAAHGQWLCADPAYVRSEAAGARLMVCPIDDISASEAAELASVLRPLFGDAGAPLAVDAPSAWCLHRLNGAPPVKFIDPSDAIGVDLLECLPEGDTGRRWRHLFNEAQILLHVHPINARRIAAGKVPVTALWFWGEGPLPDSVETSLRWMASADDVLGGLAKLTGTARLEPLPEALETTSESGDALLDLERLADRRATAEWLVTFQRWLRERRFDTLALVFARGERYRMRHAHRLRFWRRA